VSRDQAQEAMRRAAMKMPMDCKFVERFIAGQDMAAFQEELMHQYEHYIEPTTPEEAAEAAEAAEVAEEGAAPDEGAKEAAEGDAANEDQS
jgi:hypothetical protein